MKKNRYKLIPFLLIFMATLVAISCRKDVLPEIVDASNLKKLAFQESTFKQHDIKLLQKVFYEKGIGQKLIDEMDIGSISWSPEWSLASYQVRDSNTYLYVPLIPVLNKSGSSTNVKLVNQRQFLIINNNHEFQRAAFIGKSNESDDLEGSLLLTNLETNKSYKYEYSKGSYIKSSQDLPAKNKGKSDVQPLGYQLECRTKFSCTFSAVCDGTVYIHQNSTGCEYPDRDFGVGTCSIANWNLSYTTPYEECDYVYYPDPPPIPTDPGTGGGSPVSPSPVDPNRPCRLAQELKLPESTFMTTISDDLKSKLNLNYETGYYIRDNSDGWPTWYLTQGAPGAASIDITNFPAYLKGFIHTHYAGPDMLSIFSPDDLRGMYYIVNSPKAYIPPSDFYLGVIVPHEGGASYILTITDINKFREWGASSFQGELFDYSYQAVIRPNASNKSNEEGFLKLIKGHGLSLLKADKDNPQSLKRLELDNNLNVISTNCN